MKVKLLRDFLENKKGDSVEVTEERKNYWERIGLIKSEGDKEKKEIKLHREKKEVTHTPKKKK